MNNIEAIETIESNPISEIFFLLYLYILECETWNNYGTEEIGKAEIIKILTDKKESFQIRVEVSNSGPIAMQNHELVSFLIDFANKHAIDEQRFEVSKYFVWLGEQE